jgi:hypothetical protein
MAERRIAFLHLFLQELQQELAEGGCGYDMPEEVTYCLLWDEKRNSKRKTFNVGGLSLGDVPKTCSILYEEETMSAEVASQYTDTVYLAVEEMPRSLSYCH